MGWADLFQFEFHLVKRDPTAEEVFDSINAWINNVDNFNSFLNDAASLLAANDGSLLSAAQTALDNAFDEPVQLGIQASLSNLSDASQDAVSTLMGIFQTGVIDQLNSIISNPTDVDTVNNAVDTINNARRGAVLPSLDILWPAAVGCEWRVPEPAVSAARG